ncbi:flavonol synthase/flavanone 3-hydroxylase [Coniochaeta ligniaria NRRL 30616]|uniref:Flavonol synthase/flavanone 3-hydroxylase n=1 Tax=Coniochaeta ligniaria NRRL 30616 TaxID=1408157 RepID=A0A1J7IS33_9PEZI|nr:flavonol synthase/flavanone 3-hydroxylase [Coniochaeta ligniaria NRRL 30616]
MPSKALPKASLPIFDFSAFRKGDAEEKQSAATQIVDAFKRYGFVYLVNHGISPEQNQALFDWSKKFFYLPEDVRMRPALRQPEIKPNATSYIARGYTPVGFEKLSQAYDDDGLKSLRAVPDGKDMFELGPDKGIAEIREPNRYPPEDALPGFKQFTSEFFWSANELAMEVFRCIAIGLGLDEEYFVNYHQDADNLFRLIRYPAVDRVALAAGKAARTTAHTDHGSITLLFQDDVGGLEVEDPAKPGTYIVAAPIEGSVIVNVGDFLMRWTNDVLKSNLHRVVAPSADRSLSDDGEMTRERYSTAFFIQADRNKVIQCAKELEGDEGAKYPPVTAAEYLLMRRAATFKTY